MNGHMGGHVYASWHCHKADEWANVGYQWSK